MPGRSVLKLALAAALFAQPAFADRLEFVSRLSWEMNDARFGGLSSLELSKDGLNFVATSDKGMWLEGRLIRSNGRIRGVENARLTPIRDSQGQPLQTWRTDAEGLAMTPDGRLFVSFEGLHKVSEFSDTEGAGTDIPQHRKFESMQRNSSLEALAIDMAGRLYTMPERSGDLNRPFTIYRFEEGRWQSRLLFPRSQFPRRPVRFVGGEGSSSDSARRTRQS